MKMPDNYDRRLKSRENWEFEYMGQMPAEMPKVPKEGDVFRVPNLTDDGNLIGWHEYHVESISHDHEQIVFGVVPYEDDSTTYEIVWSFDLESWVQDGALG